MELFQRQVLKVQDNDRYHVGGILVVLPRVQAVDKVLRPVE
jgi:alpha-D-ribose 1-methylphosphonate 5-triphosphate synthase subunit PhnL